ncbi:chaperonin GroES [Roseiarcus fermentans]|uniref:Co-chaperonin GroES n=1 Tax=Roseiarcus fermentans TaxID=1473586 RepID=A0A366ES72_9HYPH|nr:co-chaperone GroES [Roseiarcus fermentans]RBP05154.1 chaperonin GroES [Roseiarcus fermentans]
MTFRPLFDHVVVRRVGAADRSNGAVVVPGSDVEALQEGEVVAVGPGARSESGRVQPPELKAGDRIVFSGRSGASGKIDGQDIVIMKQSEVMGVFDSAAATKTQAVWPRARLA